MPRDRMAGMPRVVLWAWEHPQRLAFLDTDRVGVAYLARTLVLGPDRVIIRPRLQPLQVPPGTALIAVARIEPHGVAASALLPARRAEAAAAIAALAAEPGVRCVQIDFEAPASQREFYRELLADVRRRLPDSTALSMTALASWCLGDRWVAGQPVDEAVPMLLRMGADGTAVAARLRAGGDFGCAECMHSVGVSTDERLPRIPAGRRVYVFTRGAWTPESVRAALASIAAAS
jgi:hypothetical protein